MDQNSLFKWQTPTPAPSPYLHPSQQYFSHILIDLPGLNQYKAEDKVSCLRTEGSTVNEVQTRNTSISSQAHHDPKYNQLRIEPHHAKMCLRVSKQVRCKPASSATET